MLMRKRWIALSAAMPAARAGLTILLEAEVIRPSAPTAAAILRTLRRVGGDEFCGHDNLLFLVQGAAGEVSGSRGRYVFPSYASRCYVESNPLIDGRHSSRGKGWWGSRGKMLLPLGALVAKSLPQSRDCKIKKGAQLQRHRALAGVDNADRHR